MEKYTIDTNVLFGACFDHTKSITIINQFLSEANSNKNFITPQVRDEIISYLAIINSVITILKGIIDKNKIPLKEAIEKFKAMGDSNFQGYFNGKFKGITEIALLKEKQGLTFETLRRYLTDRFSRFAREDICILPSMESLGPIKEILDEVEKKQIVNGDKDSKIISQLILLNRMSGDSIEFYTENPKDFKSKLPEWKNFCSFISVVSLL